MIKRVTAALVAILILAAFVAVAAIPASADSDWYIDGYGTMHDIMQFLNDLQMDGTEVSSIAMWWVDDTEPEIMVRSSYSAYYSFDGMANGYIRSNVGQFQAITIDSTNTYVEFILGFYGDIPSDSTLDYFFPDSYEIAYLREDLYMPQAQLEFRFLYPPSYFTRSDGVTAYGAPIQIINGDEYDLWEYRYVVKVNGVIKYDARIPNTLQDGNPPNVDSDDFHGLSSATVEFLVYHGNGSLLATWAQRFDNVPNPNTASAASLEGATYIMLYPRNSIFLSRCLTVVCGIIIPLGFFAFILKR